MDILLGVCRPITLSFVFAGHRIKLKLVPLPTRIAILLNYPGTKVLYYPKSEIVGAIMDASITEIEVDDEKVEWRKLSVTLQNVIFNLVATLNGLTPEGFKLVQEKLNRLKENSKAAFEKRPPPYETEEWMLLAKAAYATMRTGLPFSKDYLLDEPYLLLLAVNVIAEAESEYYESLSAQAGQAQQPPIQTPLQQLPAFPPELKERGEEGIREYMLEVFRNFTGVTIVPD